MCQGKGSDSFNKIGEVSYKIGTLSGGFKLSSGYVGSTVCESIIQYSPEDNENSAMPTNKTGQLFGQLKYGTQNGLSLLMWMEPIEQTLLAISARKCSKEVETKPVFSIAAQKTFQNSNIKFKMKT